MTLAVNRHNGFVQTVEWDGNTADDTRVEFFAPPKLLFIEADGDFDSGTITVSFDPPTVDDVEMDAGGVRVATWEESAPLSVKLDRDGTNDVIVTVLALLR